MSTNKVFPSGIVPLNVTFGRETLVTAEASEDVLALNEVLAKTEAVIANDANILLDTLTIAKKLMGNNFIGFVKLQLNRAPISLEMINYLSDTIRFICGEEREMPPHAWREIIPGPGECNASVIDRRTAADNLKRMIDKLSDNCKGLLDIYLQSWIGREDGMVDLFYALNILFGERADLDEPSEELDFPNLWESAKV